MKTNTESLPACPVETTLTLIGNKWQVLILRDLNLNLNGTMRFWELQRSVGKISQKVLTTNLRSMEESSLVHREVFAEVPSRVEYLSSIWVKASSPFLMLYGIGEKATRNIFAAKVSNGPAGRHAQNLG